MTRSLAKHPTILLVIGVVLIASSVWGASTVQRDAAERAAQQSRRGQQMLTGMLDQETGLRGYLLTSRQDFLEPYFSGRADYFNALRAARDGATTGSERRLVAEQEVRSESWRRLAASAVLSVRNGNLRAQIGPRAALRRKRQMDGFREANSGFQSLVVRAGQREQRRAGLISVVITLSLAALFGGAGMLLVRRASLAAAARRRWERAYHVTQAEFAQTMAVVDGESEAHQLLKRHLERSLPASEVTVLNRNNSDDRLEPVTVIPPQSPLNTSLEGAKPRSCAAVRLGHAVEQGDPAEKLVACEICGRQPGETTCLPLLVSGKVIGSVLVEHDQPLVESDRQRLSDSVSQAAPVLANLRNLAIAESRAATDHLTGLANRRALQDSLRRMSAQAARSGEPLAAIAIDVDHFKQINDRYGHDKGDDVLAAIGALLAAGVRASDFVGRLGGEEFLVLAPDTDCRGAAILAENLRVAMTRLDFAGVERQVTSSFGVAAIPEHAVTGDALLRLADRALYAAKSAGRNRVEVVDPVAEPVSAGAPQSS